MDINSTVFSVSLIDPRVTSSLLAIIEIGLYVFLMIFKILSFAYALSRDTRIKLF